MKNRDFVVVTLLPIALIVFVASQLSGQETATENPPKRSSEIKAELLKQFTELTVGSSSRLATHWTVESNLQQTLRTA